MEEQMRQRLSSRDIWMRALYMVLFAIAYGIAETIIFFLVVVQFFVILLTRSANEPLLGFGKNLSMYVYQILQFQTFNTETHPFPFSNWPDENAGGDRWLERKSAGEVAEPNTPSDESATRSPSDPEDR